MTQTDLTYTNPPDDWRAALTVTYSSLVVKVEAHRKASLYFAEKAEDLSELIGPLGNADRELNQKIGVALKLADVHARLALALSRAEGLES